jgi:tetratricopeptide (TPR) repeat protein
VSRPESTRGETPIQRQLSEYLQCELYHLLGAYGTAESHLGALAKRMEDEGGADPYNSESDPDDERPGSAALAELVDMAKRHNHQLCWHRYATNPRDRSNPARSGPGEVDSSPAREPLPEKLPLTDIKRFRIGPRGESVTASRISPWASDEEWNRVPRFYSEAITALESHTPVVDSIDDKYVPGNTDETNRHNFARSLIAPRDGATDWKREGASEWKKIRAARDRLDRRLDRYRQRRKLAVQNIGSSGRPDDDGPPLEDEDLCDAYPRDERFLELIINDDLTDGDESLPVFVLRVQAEAHLSMHAVEAWRGMCLGEHAQAAGEEERVWLKEELERSIALSTFAFCVSRTAPWIFAKSEEERLNVVEDVSVAWENMVPTRCMWIASQIGLLSLHRRAYARALKGDPQGAYNDYHKLQRLIRDTKRRVRAAPLHVDGALEFLSGLTAEAHHHIGELYRSEHAHKPALEHFKAASYRLELLRNESTGNEVLTNSRWYVELQISHGKAYYEMGRHKEALFWHLRAWLAFLELLSSETRTETNTEDIEKAIAWLESVKYEPELRKSEISERMRPVVDQLDRITMVGRVGALAAEILLRLGHLLFVLNVGYFDSREDNEPNDEAARERVAHERIRSTLAFACLLKASECDPYSTLVGADLLKTRFRFNGWRRGPLPAEYQAILEPHPLKPIDEHWPRGGDDYERLTRVAEYLMLKSQKPRFEVGETGRDSGKPMSLQEREDEAEALLARDLLLDLFMSTDSINVRKSQIHRFLMRPKVSERLPREHRAPAIEFVCMRRFSSPFPLLPRPAAFRALGGGYFVRLHGKPGGGEEPYGIVVDPGVDFVENLYRTGYSLSDIDMIVITHDHVDHLGGLDPLLSLLHVRSEVLSKQQGTPPPASAAEEGKVTVLTSRGVEQRYKRVKRLVSKKSNDFRFKCFEDLMDESGVLRSDEFLADLPEGFEIVAMSSAIGTENEETDGHRDLSGEPSHGLCFRVAEGNGPSVAITSDTPPPPDSASRRRYARWRKTWEPALSADILVVHLGSVPLTELRRMDMLGKAILCGGEEKDDDCDEFEQLLELQSLLQGADEHLQGQIEYAQWLRSHVPKGADPVETASLVGPVPERWLPPPEHNYLVGLLRWAREYRKRWGPGKFCEDDPPTSEEPQGLFVIGELSEELGTMRGKVATRVNDRVFDAGRRRKRHDERDSSISAPIGFPYALTADIGLHACVTTGEEGSARVEVLCTTCHLDTDRAPEERYHPAHDVYEVCVKGENEGVFYNCLEHDPARQGEPAFLEQLERFDIFGR